MNRFELLNLEVIASNSTETIRVIHNKNTHTYEVTCYVLASEERAYRYGEYCYRSKVFKYKKSALKLFEKLVSYFEDYGKQYIINNQERWFK